MSPELIAIIGVGIAMLTVQISIAGLMVTLMLQSEKRSNQRIDRLEDRITHELQLFRAETNQRFARQEDQTKQQFARMEDQTKQQFARMEDQTKQQLAELETRTNQRFNQTDQRFDQLQAETQRQFSELEARANQRFDQLQAETKRQFERVEDHLHSLAGGQGHLAGEISMLKDLFTHLFPGNNPA